MTSVHVGTSGYAYKEWKGLFYPEKLPAAAMLKFYSEQFGTVEINNTFYRMPKADMLRKWCDTVPQDFVFTLKAPQRLTHIKRLKEVGDDAAYFFEQGRALGPRRGPTLVQLPPNFKRNDDRLVDFFACVPTGERIAFEFRHTSWFDEAVYAVLRAHNAALCIADVDKEPKGGEIKTPWVATANWGYARLRRIKYTKPTLQKIATWFMGQKFADAFVYLKHEDGARGPGFARTFRSLCVGAQKSR